MGVILKGRDTDLGRDVAMKLLRADHANRPEVVQRFVEEAQIDAQLSHPGIVPVYELGLMAGRRPYFTMKLVKGRTLAAHLEERSDPSDNLRRFIGIFEQVCQTVAYAHSRHVIHRDLKPSNVMIGPFGEVLVVDWGFAKVLTIPEDSVVPEERKKNSVIRTVRTGSGSDSLSGSVMGTPAYMPPEQAIGDVEKVDTRSDVFSLGAILLEILTGSPPYPPKSDDLLVLAARADLEECRKELDRCSADADLVELCRSCLATEREDRPRDAGVLARRVADYLSSLDEMARRAEVRAAEEKVRAVAARRSRKLALLLACAVLAAILLLGGGYTLWSTARMERRADTARRVDDYLRKAEEKRGLKDFEAARSEIRKAEQAVLTGVADDGIRKRVEDAGAAIDTDLAAARALAARRARDAAMARLLQDLRNSREGTVSRIVSEEDFATAFREYGIDVERLPVEEAAKRMKATDIAAELAGGLDPWAVIAGTYSKFADEKARRIYLIAQKADPDRLRCRLRDAVMDHDVSRLQGLAAEAQPEELETNSVNILASMLEQLGDTETALEVLRRAAEARPDRFWVNAQLGYAYSRRNPPEYEEALAWYRAALAARPDSSIMRENIGYCLEKLGDLHTAISWYRDAFEAKRTLFRSYVRAVKALGKLDLLDDEIISLEEAIEKRPEDAILRTMLGICLRENEEYADSIRNLRKSIALDSSNAHHHFQLGNSLFKEKRWREAMRAFEKAIELKPKFLYPYNELGRCRIILNDIDGAVKAYEGGVKVTESAPYLWHNLAHAYAIKGWYDKARDAYNEAIRLDPSDAEIYGCLGGLHYAFGYQEAACESCRVALKLNSELPWAHFILGYALARRAQIEDAVQHFKKAQELIRDLDLINDDPERFVAESEWMEELCRVLPEMEDRLRAVLSGKDEPEDAEERLLFARLAFCHEEYVGSARLFQQLYRENPELLTVVRFRSQEGLYTAACAACQASTDGSLSERERSRWRRQALAWLDENLEFLWKLQGQGEAEDRRIFQSKMLWRLRTFDLKGIREPRYLNAMPAEDRKACRAFLERVKDLFEKSRREP
jgi:serine/threonine-protein kinase